MIKPISYINFEDKIVFYRLLKCASVEELGLMIDCLVDEKIHRFDIKLLELDRKLKELEKQM